MAVKRKPHLTGMLVLSLGFWFVVVFMIGSYRNGEATQTTTTYLEHPFIWLSVTTSFGEQGMMTPIRRYTVSVEDMQTGNAIILTTHPRKSYMCCINHPAPTPVSTTIGHPDENAATGYIQSVTTGRTLPSRTPTPLISPSPSTTPLLVMTAMQ